MALFNTFLNTNQTEGSDYPAVVQPGGTGRSAGATFRQTVIGLEYRGPSTPFGAQVSGSLFMDFFGGTGQLLGQEMRLRTASIQLGWKNSSITAGLEKPIFAPREPNSLAQVGVSPLTGAGNLWLWIPQVRFEHVLRFSGETSGLRAQVGAVQTREQASYQVGSFEPRFERARPGIEGRFEFFHDFGNGRRFEIAPGFHASTSHVAATSVPSDLVSVDWLASPWSKLQWSGTFFTGRNVAHFGTGGSRQGFTAVAPGVVDPVHSRGGWTQITWFATNRLSFNLFSGQHDDRNRDLRPGRIGKNLAYGANFFYRLAPNVLLGLETSQFRTTYLGLGNRLNNHYDLALAYLF